MAGTLHLIQLRLGNRLLLLRVLPLILGGA